MRQPGVDLDWTLHRGGALRAWVVAAASAALLGCVPTSHPVPTAPAAPSESTSAVAASCEGMDACKTACDSGALEACVRAGNAAYDAHDQARAAAYYHRACPDGPGPRDDRGCQDFAVLLIDGQGVAADPPRAVALFASGCERGWGASCESLAVAYESGGRVPKDEAKGAKLEARACELGEMHGCYSVGDAYDQGKGVAADEARARVFIQKACDAHVVTACAALREMDGRARPLERAVGRWFVIGHRGARLRAVDRSPEQARQLAVAAVAELAQGKSFDDVADRFGGAKPLDRIGRDQRVFFRPKSDDPNVPVFALKPGQAVFRPHPAFGILVWLRLR